MLGLTDPFRLGDLSWFVRVRCTPDTSASIGSALARRTDTTWVNLTSGGTETMAAVRTRGPGLEEPFLVQKLPRTPGWSTSPRTASCMCSSARTSASSTRADR